MSAYLQFDMDKEQQLFHRIVEGELLCTLGKAKQAIKVLAPCSAKTVDMGRKDLAMESLVQEGIAHSQLGNQTLALERLDLPAANVLMIGDNVDTDIKGANNAGLMSALVETGVPVRDLSTTKPTVMVADLDELKGLLETALAQPS